MLSVASRSGWRAPTAAGCRSAARFGEGAAEQHLADRGAQDVARLARGFDEARRSAGCEASAAVVGALREEGVRLREGLHRAARLGAPAAREAVGAAAGAYGQRLERLLAQSLPALAGAEEEPAGLEADQPCRAGIGAAVEGSLRAAVGQLARSGVTDLGRCRLGERGLSATLSSGLSVQAWITGDHVFLAFPELPRLTALLRGGASADVVLRSLLQHGAERKESFFVTRQPLAVGCKFGPIQVDASAPPAALALQLEDAVALVTKQAELLELQCRPAAERAEGGEAVLAAAASSATAPPAARPAAVPEVKRDADAAKLDSAPGERSPHADSMSISQLVKGDADAAKLDSAPGERGPHAKSTSISQLAVGQQLRGTVRKVTKIGAFVDVGVERHGLVRASRMAEGFVANPQDAVAVGQEVDVWVYRLPEDKKLGLSMVAYGPSSVRDPLVAFTPPAPAQWFAGAVRYVHESGLYVDVEAPTVGGCVQGFVPRRLASGEPARGSRVQVRVLRALPGTGTLSLSMLAPGVDTQQH